jgi:hypothetical protein
MLGGEARAICPDYDNGSSASRKSMLESSLHAVA